MWSIRRDCGRWARGGSTRSSSPFASPSSAASSISVASTTVATWPSRDAPSVRPRSNTTWTPTVWSPIRGSTRRSAFLLGPAVGVAGGDLRHHPGERVVQIDVLRVRDTDHDEQDVGELHRQGSLAFFLLLGLLPEPMVDFAGQLPDLFRQPGQVGERREVALLILTDPAVDRLLGFAQGHERLRGIVNAELPPLVAPFRGERYASRDRLGALVAPPYDVISKADRLALLRATRTSLESIFLLAPDPDRALARALMEAASGAPAARAELDGVDMRLWVVSGDRAAELSRLAGRAQLYIADGHHRYETAAAYAQEAPGADRVLAFVVSAGDPGLAILPTHRIIFGSGRDAPKLLEGWRRWFDVGRVAPCMDRVERLAELGQLGTACIVAFPGAYDVTLVLKRGVSLDGAPGLGNSPAIRALDVARIEALVVQFILGADPATPSLAYTPDPRAAFDAVRTGKAAAAVLLNPTRVEDVFAVADAGDVMPPKSTYFVPKVPSGLVLRPLT